MTEIIQNEAKYIEGRINQSTNMVMIEKNGFVEHNLITTMEEGNERNHTYRF